MTSRPRLRAGSSTLSAIFSLGGELRGYVRYDRERPADASMNPALELFGDGYLAITFDQPASNERYQGIVPLEGKNLADAAELSWLSPSRS